MPTTIGRKRRFECKIRCLRKFASEVRANWGIAFMSMGNPFAWPANQRAMMAAAAAIGEAKRVGAKTQREHDYITALDTYFSPLPTKSCHFAHGLRQASAGTMPYSVM
jgi:hypothetical protein